MGSACSKGSEPKSIKADGGKNASGGQMVPDRGDQGGGSNQIKQSIVDQARRPNQQQKPASGSES